jgi:hypothetical protein
MCLYKLCLIVPCVCLIAMQVHLYGMEVPLSQCGMQETRRQKKVHWAVRHCCRFGCWFLTTFISTSTRVLLGVKDSDYSTEES